MCVFSFSPNEIPMQQLEKQYQHKGHAKWMDIARIYATPSNPNAGWEKLDAYWRSFMLDDANNIPYGTGTDDLLLRLSRHVGKDIRPLFHFWGIHPQNPSALAAALAAENLTPDPAIKDKLLHYKSIVPADNAAFQSFCLSWWGRKPTVAGAWEETDHAMQWDEALDADGTNDPNVRPTITTGSKYVEGCAAEIRARVDELVDLYFPSGITPSQMSFAIAPSAVNSTTIGMTAVTATAANPPISYYFENTTNTTNSGWITGTSWQQTGLAAGNYSYRVKARNGLGEETAWSEPVVAALTASGDITPPAPSPMTFSTPPYATDENTITMTATTASDVNGVEYEFENTSGGGSSSGWQSSPVFTDGELSPSTEYGYRVRARDSAGNTTAWSASSTTNTADIPDVTSPQIISLNPSGAFTDVAANLVVTFDEPVLVGSGNITLKNLTDGTQTLIAINDAARVSISGAVVTINPATDLSINKSYAILIAAGALVDTSNNPFIGISNDTTWAFNVILQDPLAVAGGPYNVILNASLSLDGSGSMPSEGATITNYEWDLDNDGDYDEAIVTATPAAIGYATLTAPPPSGFGMVAGTNTIKLRVTDSAAKTATAETTVNLLQLFTFDGANKSNGDNWNVATNWNPDAVPAGFAEVVIPAGKYVTADNTNPQPYSGNLTIGAGATLQCGYSAGSGYTYMNALGTAGSTTITMGAGSGIILRGNYSPAFPAMVLQGDVSLTIGTSTSGGPDPAFSKGISGPYTVYLEGKSDSFMTIDTTPNTFSGLIVRQVTASGLNINANVAGALGTGDVTIRANQSGIISGNLVLGATDAIANSATLSLYGPASSTKLKLTANNFVRRLLIDGVTQPAGTYGKIGSGAQHEVSWINSTSTATLTVAAAPSLYWDLNDSTAGAGSTAGDASGTWNSTDNLWNNADGDEIALPWTAGQQAVFSAGTDATGTYGVTVSGTHDIGGLDFKNGNVTLSGGGLRMTSDSESNVGTGLTANITTPISNDSARRLTKLGGGTLTLSGASTYTGPTRIDQGILSVASMTHAGTDSPLGNYPTSGAGGLILSGGTFQYTGASTTVNRGLTLMGDSTLDLPAAGTTLTLGNCETANQSGILTVTGGAGSILAIGQARIVEAAQLTLNPTTATMIVGSADGYTSYNQKSILTLGGASTGNTVSGVISQTNPPGSSFAQTLELVKSGSGDWRLNGASTYTGNTTVNAGNLIAGTNALNNANGAFGKATSEINLGVANGNDNAGILIGGAFTIGRAIRLVTANTTDTGTRVLTIGGNSAHASVFSGAIILGTASQAGRGVTLTAANGGTVTFSGVIQNPASMDATTYTVTKSGPGKVVLSNSNTYTGGTLVAEGALEITGATQATASITFNSGAKLGLAIATPVTAANAAVNLTNGQIAVTGTPSGPSHTLLTAQSITGTPVLDAAISGYKLEVVGNQLQLNQIITDPYTAWSDGAAFDADANVDGVDNGMAWLLGVADKDASALGKLPIATQTGGGLTLTFRCLNAGSRGAAALHLEHSGNLGQTGPWASVAVPETSGPVGGVNFTITPDGDFNNVTATIPTGEALSGKLFARLRAVSAP
jgi:autotransporter-associated beta strand protein